MQSWVMCFPRFSASQPLHSKMIAVCARSDQSSALMDGHATRLDEGGSVSG